MIDKQQLIGTWKLVSSKRTILETSEVIDSYGPNPTGWITYGDDERMMVVVAHDGRKNLPVTDHDATHKVELFSSFFAYSGTYELHGSTIAHHIDVSWNEAWTGTSMRRSVEIEDGRAVYRTEPFAFSGDGKQSIVTLVWEKFRPA